MDERRGLDIDWGDNDEGFTGRYCTYLVAASVGSDSYFPASFANPPQL